MKIDIEFNSGAQLPMDAIPDLARLAEAHGFDCAWGGEANNKDPTVMLVGDRRGDHTAKDRFRDLPYTGPDAGDAGTAGGGFGRTFGRSILCWASARRIQPSPNGMAILSIIRWAACRNISRSSRAAMAWRETRL